MLLKSETSDVGSRRLGVVAWLADAARPFRIVRIQTHFDQLLTLVWPMVVDGAGCSAHSLVPAAVSCADAAWISCEHLPAAPPVPGGRVWVSTWSAPLLGLALAVGAFTSTLNKIRASCGRADLEHWISLDDVEAMMPLPFAKTSLPAYDKSHEPCWPVAPVDMKNLTVVCYTSTAGRCQVSSTALRFDARQMSHSR